MANIAAQAVATTSLVKEKAVVNVNFGELTAFTQGGTDFEVYYDIPAGGYDQIALALGRAEIKLQAENRALVWSFYAAQASRDVCGHVLVKNQRLPATKIGHYKLTPQQVAMAQLQKVNGRRLYLGILRMGYTSAVDVAGPPNAADCAVTLTMTMQVRVRGRHVARVNECFSVVSLPQGYAYDEATMAVINKAVDMDGMSVGTTGAPTAGVTVFAGALLKGTALACLETLDQDATYGGMTWQAFLTANIGASFRLEVPVVLTVLDLLGAVTTATANFHNVVIALNSTGVAKAFLYVADPKAKNVRGGTMSVLGLAAGDMQIRMMRSKLVLPESNGSLCLTALGENYDAVYDIKREGAKKKKAKKGAKSGGGAAEGRKMYSYMKIPVPAMLSKKVSTNHFFPQPANKKVAGLFTGATAPWAGGVGYSFRVVSGYEAMVLETINDTY